MTNSHLLIVIFKDKYKSMIFPDKLYLTSDYRIGKEIMNFRGPGDYDKEMVYVEFTV